MLRTITLAISLLALSGCIHAQSTATGTSTSIGTSISGPSGGTGAVCDITTTSVPTGTAGVPYGPATLTTTGCVAPLTWSISSGSLPTGLSLNSVTGVISGTPSGAGTSSPTFHVIDTNGKSDIFDTAVTIAASGGSTPALPDSALLTLDTTIANTPSPVAGAVTVGDGITGICAPDGCSYTTSQLSTAVAAVGCGQTLELSNVVYQPLTALNFVKTCDAGNWITVTRDTSDATFPAEGTRVMPCYSGIPSSALTGMPTYTCASPARHMPFIQKISASIFFNIFGSYYRFVGIEWGRTNGYDLDPGIIAMNNNAACTAPDVTCMNKQPSHIIFDRNIIHGDAQRQTSHAIGLGGARWVAPLDSYIYDIGLTVSGGGGDAQPFAWGNGKNLTNTGWMKIQNNFLSASTMGNLFCGSFSEPLSPSTGFDGIPHDFWFNQNWHYKNELWDTQRFQTQAVSGTVEGVSYPPVGDQEFILYPAAMQLQVGQSITLQSLTANDSWSGIGRSPAGTTTLSCGSADCGSQTTICAGCGPANPTPVGTGDYISQAQFVTTYTAPATVPVGTTASVTRSWSTSDDRAGSNFGKSRTLSSTAVFTIVSGTPTPQIVLTPKAGDLQIQPSYSDSFGNSRQFELMFTPVLNFAPSTMTWAVDGITNGNATVGQMCSYTSASTCVSPPALNGSFQAVYWSGTATGNHTITVTSNTGVTDSSVINVSTTAPIVEWDYRAFTSKNGFELKCGRKGLVENFFIENDWGANGNGGGQGGQCFLAHPFNQSGCPGNCSTSVLSGGTAIGYGPFEISDLTIRNGKGLRHGAGFVIGGSTQTLGIHRVSITNVLCDDCDYKHNSHGFSNSYFSTQANGGPSTVFSWESAANPMMSDVVYRHITLVGGDWPQGGTGGGTFGINADVAQPKGLNYVMQDSILASTGSTTFMNPNGGNTNCNTAAGSLTNNTELKALPPCFATYTFNHLALLDSTANPNVFLSSPIWQPASNDVGLFRNYNGGVGGDYRVVAGGIYDAGGARQASDSTALGADEASLSVVEQNVRTGVTTGLPFSISTSSLPNATHNVAYSQTLSVSGGVSPFVWSTPADITPSGAIDILDYAMMPLPDRNSFHLTGDAVKYFHLDNGLMWWMKSSTGHPWDGEMVGADYIYQWFTEGPTFGNASGYKKYVNPVPLWKRYHVPGADDIVTTSGPNKYDTTESCGSDALAQIDNLDVKGELTGPFTDVTWTATFGGSIPDNTPYLLATKFIKGSGGVYQNREQYWLVLGFGQVKWQSSHLSGGVYVTDSTSVNTTKTAGGAPTPSFACGVPALPITNSLPLGTSLTSSPSLNLGDTTGTISGTPTTVGTKTFTVQVEDAVGHIATKTFTLTVN